MDTVKELNAALATSLNPIHGALHDMKDKITEVETRLTENSPPGLKDLRTESNS
jgi:hypothetical protein